MFLTTFSSTLIRLTFVGTKNEKPEFKSKPCFWIVNLSYLIVIEKKMLRVIILFNKIIISIIFLQWKNEMNQQHHTNYQCFALHGKYQYDVINCYIRIIFIINISILIYYNTILYSKEIIVTIVTIFYLYCCYYGCFFIIIIIIILLHKQLFD